MEHNIITQDQKLSFNNLIMFSDVWLVFQLVYNMTPQLLKTFVPLCSDQITNPSGWLLWERVENIKQKLSLKYICFYIQDHSFGKEIPIS